MKNKNHHAEDKEIFNYKVYNSHAQILLSLGILKLKIKEFYDDIGMSTSYKIDNKYMYRWIDTVLIKIKKMDLKKFLKIRKLV